MFGETSENVMFRLNLWRFEVETAFEEGLSSSLSLASQSFRQFSEESGAYQGHLLVRRGDFCLGHDPDLAMHPILQRSFGNCF